MMTRSSRPPCQIEMPPSRRLPAGPSIGVLVLGAAVVLVLLIGLMLLDQALRTPAAPHGIVSLELAGSMETAQRILASWPASARIQAGVSLGLDFFFLAAYAFTLAGVSCKVASHLPVACGRFKSMGGLLAGAAWLAGCLDVVENLSLIQFMVGPGQAWQPALAAGCAWPKFGLTSIVLLYIGIGGVVVLRRRKERNPR